MKLCVLSLLFALLLAGTCALGEPAPEALPLEAMQQAESAIMAETFEDIKSPDEPDESHYVAVQTSSPTPRDDLIDDIIALAEQLYTNANGRSQRAHYAGDIYICKNFVAHLFLQTAGAYRMAEYPDVPLTIPDNLPREECEPYSYGIAWTDIPASEGNPFYAAARFRYNDALTDEQNRANARAFLRQVRRGDYFQMAANYYYGIGAHSLVFIADYDSQTDSVHWTDSNMKGERRNGERYAYVQYDAKREIDWFIDAFCRKGYGATIYRLRGDIVRAE